MKKESYIMIEGKKIPLSSETVKSLKGEMEEDNLVSFKKMNNYLSANELNNTSVQIGQGAVEERFKGKSIIVGKDIDIEVIDNKKPHTNIHYPKVIIFKKRNQ